MIDLSVYRCGGLRSKGLLKAFFPQWQPLAVGDRPFFHSFQDHATVLEIHDVCRIRLDEYWDIVTEDVTVRRDNGEEETTYYVHPRLGLQRAPGTIHPVYLLNFPPGTPEFDALGFVPRRNTQLPIQK